MSATVLSFAALVGTVFLSRTIGGAALEWCAAGALILLCIAAGRGATVREVVLGVAASALAIAVLVSGGTAADLRTALELGAFFAAFILLLTALKIAAERSRSVIAVGRALIRQPAGRRFAATAGGGHILGVFLNFGAISLMAPMIQNAARSDDGVVDPVLERRQISALLRGFAWVLLWAPTTLAQAVLLTLFTDIDQSRVIALGIATAVLMMTLGMLHDRIEWRGAAEPCEAAPQMPRTALFRLALICGTLIGLTVLVQIGGDMSTALSLMVVAPLVTGIWFRFQPSTVGRGKAFMAALEHEAPGLARSAMALGLSGFIGRALADVVPVSALNGPLDTGGMPGWAFLAALPILITLGGQVALSPIILVVFIGQVVQQFPALPAAPEHIVFALGCGWAISMFASPNATATLLISATTRIAPTRLTWSWNLRYGVLSYLVLVGLFLLLEPPW